MGIVFALVLFGWPAAAQGDEADALLDRGQRAAEQTFADLNALGLPGALVGLASGAGETQRLAFGVANVETGEPLHVDATMRIGSVAKLVVGTLVLQLVDDGRLKLNDPVSKYVPDVPCGDEITLLMLGTHTSGLFNPIADPAFRKRINASPSSEVSFADVMNIVRRNSTSVEPGTAFSYSNANTVLLARVIEAITDMSLSDNIEMRIRHAYGVETPLIPSTHALPDPQLRGYRFGQRAGAVEYGRVFFDATAFSASWAGAAGNMNATLDELLRLAKPLAAGSTLADDMRRALHDFKPVTEDFAYGFHIARFGEAIGHAGDVPGFSSFLAWVPGHDLSVVVLCNLSNLADKRNPAELIGRAVIEALGAPRDER